MHHHFPVKKLRQESGFRGCVSLHDCNPAAHGNIEVRDTCRCGATRRMLVNQQHVESSGWIESSEEARTV